MTSVLLRLGVDPVQWRALLKTSLRMDFPVMVKTEAKSGAPRKPRGRGMIWLLVAFYVAAGISPAVVVYFSTDVLLGATSLATVIAFLVASMLLMGEGTTIVSPGDHLILGFRPVTSRTYLAVRVSALLVRTVVVSGAASFIPAIVFLVRRGMFPGRAIAAVVTGQLTGIAVTLAIVAMYGWVLRNAGPARTTRITSYVQLIASTVVWGGFMLATQVLNERTLAGLTLSETQWWLALPPSWFASWVLLGAGRFEWMAFVGAVLSLVTIAGLVRVIGDKLSMEYTEQLSKLASVTESAGAKRREWFAALNDETRAVAMLVRSQLEHDMKFRLGLISLIPITVIYMIAGGMPTDPFVRGTRGGNPGLIQMALIFIPMSLRQAIVNSESYRASWIFHTTPADRGKLVLSSRNIITAFFLLPYLACMAAMFAYAFGDAGHALLHAGFLGLVSWTVLQFLIMLSPQLPFSLPHGKDAQAMIMFVRMLGAMTIGMASYFALVGFVYRHPARMVVAAAVFIGLGLLMDRLTHRRVSKRRVEEIYTD